MRVFPARGLSSGVGVTPPTPDAIRAMLDAAGVKYRHVVHAPTRTSEESASARGEPIEVGAKAMVLKVGDAFGLYVLSAARKLDSGAIKRRTGVKSVRFATPEELMELTGLVPGSVPPFGRPLLPLDLNLEAGVPLLPKVAFNAGSLTESLILATPDYLRVASSAATFAFAAA